MYIIKGTSEEDPRLASRNPPAELEILNLKKTCKQP